MNRCARLHALAMAIIAGVLMGLVTSSLHAQDTTRVAVPMKKIKSGAVPIPGSPNDTIKFTVTQQKPPNPGCDTNIDKQLQYWFDIKLCRKDTTKTTPVKFIICTMLNVNQPKKKMKKIKMYYDSTAKQWKCKEDGETEWYPNVHLGCKEFTLSTQGQSIQGFDTTVTFPFRFTDAQIASTYTDILRSADNGIDTATCKDMVGECKFLVPGDGTFPDSANGTSSFWIQNGGKFSIADAGRADTTVAVIPGPLDTCVHPIDTIHADTIVNRMLVPTGNMYTMAVMGQEYESLLDGYLANAPIGSELLFKFPPSAGTGRRSIRVTSDTTRFQIPFTITDHLMEDADEHTYVVVKYRKGTTYPDTNSAMVFAADVRARNLTRFPDGSVIFRPGQWMHGVLLNWVWDGTPPHVIYEGMERSKDDPEALTLVVRSVDEGTMATSALFRYCVNGRRQPDRVIDFAREPMQGDTTVFSVQLGRFAAATRIDSCEIYLKDLSGNMSRTVIPDFHVAGLPTAPLAAGFRLDEAVPNPTAHQSRIGFAIPQRAHVRLDLFDANGRNVAVLVDADLDAGNHSATVDAEALALPAGIYYYRLRSGELMQARALVVEPVHGR